jgi:hypothetical protein
MAKSSKQRTVNLSDTSVVLVKYPARRAFSLIVAVVLIVLFTAWIWAALKRGDMPWYAIGVPLVFIGLLTSFLQPEEEWLYTPWQETTQKYEKNIYD